MKYYPTPIWADDFPTIETIETTWLFNEYRDCNAFEFSVHGKVVVQYWYGNRLMTIFNDKTMNKKYIFSIWRNDKMYHDFSHEPTVRTSDVTLKFKFSSTKKTLKLVKYFFVD
jgi:hypothetical protein